MAKIEVVIDGDQFPAERELFIEAGGTGYTDPETPEPSVTTATSGRLLFNDRASLSMLIAVMPEDKVSSLVTGLRRLLEGRHGIFFVT